MRRRRDLSAAAKQNMVFGDSKLWKCKMQWKKERQRRERSEIGFKLQILVLQRLQSNVGARNEFIHVKNLGCVPANSAIRRIRSQSIRYERKFQVQVQRSSSGQRKEKTIDDRQPFCPKTLSSHTWYGREHKIVNVMQTNINLICRLE